MYKLFVPGQHKEKELFYLDCFQNECTFHPLSPRSQILPPEKKIKVILATLVANFPFETGVWLKDSCVETNILISGYLQGIDDK